MEERTQKLEKVPTRVTRWIGTVSSLVVHTIFFAIALTLPFFGLSTDNVLLILTTIVSLEAIYLSLFIQMTVNRNTESIVEVQEDVQEISEDVEEISKDVEEISEDVDKINEEEQKDNIDDERTKVTLEKIEGGLQKLLLDIEALKQQKQDLDTLKQNNQPNS